MQCWLTNVHLTINLCQTSTDKPSTVHWHSLPPQNAVCSIIRCPWENEYACRQKQVEITMETRTHYGSFSYDHGPSEQQLKTNPASFFSKLSSCSSCKWTAAECWHRTLPLVLCDSLVQLWRRTNHQSSHCSDCMHPRKLLPSTFHHPLRPFLSCRSFYSHSSRQCRATK